MFATASSLGCYCETAYQLKRGNRNIVSSPLDWMFSQVRSIEKAIADDFVDLFRFDRLSLAQDRKSVIENTYGLCFFHTFSQLADGTVDESKLAEDFDRQIGKYKYLVDETNRVFQAPQSHLYFIRWNTWYRDHEPAKVCAARLIDLLRTKHLNGSCSLVVVQAEAEREPDWNIDGVFNRYTVDVTASRWQGDNQSWDALFREFQIAEKQYAKAG